MSFRRLDDKGKPLPRNGRTKRQPSEREINGKQHFHYTFTVAIKQPDGAYKYIHRNKWFPGDAAAKQYEDELSHRAKPKIGALSWDRAYSLWLDGIENKRSPKHLGNVEATMKRWKEAVAPGKTIEDTTLAEFTGWIRERSKSGKGRGAQIDQAHLLAISRWCREQGLTTEIPFDNAPTPEARTDTRRPATIEEFHAVADALPHHIALLWRLLGFTGMRLGAACTLSESDITPDDFTVTTKGDKRVTYPITPPIRDIINQAHAWKAERGIADRPTLFCNVRGTPWNSRSIGGRIDDIIMTQNNQAEKGKDVTPLPKITAHQLRHLAGTILGEKNFSVPKIMAALGHANPASSQVYIDKTQKMRNDAMNMLVKNLSKNDPESALSSVIITDAMFRKLAEGVAISCPCCSRKFLLKKKIKAQPK